MSDRNKCSIYYDLEKFGREIPLTPRQFEEDQRLGRKGILGISLNLHLHLSLSPLYYEPKIILSYSCTKRILYITKILEAGEAPPSTVSPSI